MLERARMLEMMELLPMLDEEKKIIPDLPRRGEVDVIVGGMFRNLFDKSRN